MGRATADVASQINSASPYRHVRDVHLVEAQQGGFGVHRRPGAYTTSLFQLNVSTLRETRWVVLVCQGLMLSKDMDDSKPLPPPPPPPAGRPTSQEGH